MDCMGRIGVLITWNEIVGYKPSKAELCGQLSPYSLGAVLLGLSRTSAILNNWQARHNPATDFDVARQTLPKHIEMIRQLTSQRLDRVLFSRASILYVAKQAVRACPIDGKAVVTQSDVERIMECCLMANDLLLAKTPDPRDQEIDKAASMMTFNNYLPDADEPLNIGRNLILLEEIAPQLTNRPDYRDLEAEFEAASGLTPRMFCQLVWGSVIRFVGVDGNKIPDDILQPEYFRTTNAGEAATRFLSKYSIPLAKLKIDSSNDTTLDNDFLLLQKHPLIEFQPGQHLCIDAGFLMQKAGKSFSWTLLDEATSKARQHLLGYWPLVVEKYAQWFTEASYGNVGKVISSPKFANGDEAADLVIKEGNNLALIEIKACTLSAKAKYSFDRELLFDELKRKAIYGDDSEAKGIRQLHKTIRRFQDGDDIENIRNVQVSKIYPVLLFLDRSFLSPYALICTAAALTSAALPGGPRSSLPTQYRYEISKRSCLTRIGTRYPRFSTILREQSSERRKRCLR